MADKTLLSIFVFALCLTFPVHSVLYAASSDKVAKRIEDATWVLDEFMGSPDREAAVDLIKRSAAVAIFPTVYKGAFIIGAQYGKGVIVSHDKVNKTWSAPAFLTLGGGSVGFQIGGEAVDLILVIMNERGVKSLLRGKGTLGADISVAAGPVGRKAQAETDVLLKAEIYSYSKAKGAFIGISLKGAVLAPDNKEANEYYGHHVYAEEILIDKREAPGEPGLKLIETLNKFVK